MIINDGNYYLLAFDDYSKEIRTYRVDRMKALKRTGLIKFRMSLLDAAIERFGRANVSYIKNDEHHFTLSTDI